MNCNRAAAVLRGLETNELSVSSEEIEELLALGLAVEADPDDLQLLYWLQPVVREYARRDVDDPYAAQGLSESLRETEEELKKDWYRMRATKTELAQREGARVTMRRALAYLNDRALMAGITALARSARSLAPGARYVCCEPLGSEYYAITHKGWRVRRHLQIRLDRLGEATLKSFLHSVDKAEAKMRSFGAEVTGISANIGYVRKNREQVVVGLVKSGAPAAQAIGAYQTALRAANNAPDVAVTCVRNAATFGSPAHAAQRLQQAQAAMVQAGLPRTPIAMGAAKSLLTYQPQENALPRFIEILRRLERSFGRQEMNFKFAARLMPAAGTPEDVVRRAVEAVEHLRLWPSRAVPYATDHRSAAVALASMVRSDDQLHALVQRFREIELELVRAGQSTQAHAEADALECVACPGTPAEVVDTVATLASQLAQGRQTERGDVAIAVAFAKRFAF